MSKRVVFGRETPLELCSPWRPACLGGATSGQGPYIMLII